MQVPFTRHVTCDINKKPPLLLWAMSAALVRGPARFPPSPKPPHYQGGAVFLAQAVTEPAAAAAIVLRGTSGAAMSHWRNSTARADVMRGTGEDEAAYVAGWTVSGLATLATILFVWVFAI